MLTNDGKTEVIVIGSEYQLSKIEYFVLTVERSNVHPYSTVKNLGVTFDENLNFDKHIFSVCKKFTINCINYIS